MLLYHGTNEAVARAALTEGLRPRCETGAQSHWSDCPSRDDLVYLTTAYAGYFALHATDNLEPWGIVEIDTDRLPEFHEYLVPDEDWVEQSCRNDRVHTPLEYQELSMPERTAFWRERLHHLTDLWQDSVRGLGNCAHLGPIEAGSVTRVSIFNPATNPEMTASFLDPTISILNYQICGPKYRALVRWLMKESITINDYLGFGGILRDALPPGTIEHLQKVIENQHGIEILS